MGAIGYFVKRHDSRMSKLEEETDSNRTDLLEYKLDAEKYFAKDTTVQASLSRVHDRLDEIGDDIKTLIAQGARNEHNHKR